MKVKVISDVQEMLYTRRNLPIYKGEFELELGAQDLENYKKEIEDRKLKIKMEEIKDIETIVIHAEVSEKAEVIEKKPKSASKPKAKAEKPAEKPKSKTSPNKKSAKASEAKKPKEEK